MRSSATVKKTYNLPPALVDRARRVLRVRTETEAIVISLREVAFLDEVDKAIRRTGGRLPDFQSVR